MNLILTMIAMTGGLSPLISKRAETFVMPYQSNEKRLPVQLALYLSVCLLQLNDPYVSTLFSN